MSSTVVAITNQKGGVGKSTTAINLGAGLALQGDRVLLVDLDPQSNATSGLGFTPDRVGASIYDVLLKDTAIEDAIEPTSVKGLFLVPSSINLAAAEIELVSVMSREQRLKGFLSQVAGDYDFVLIDCPPSLGLLTVNALAAATEVLIPIQCEYFALEGLSQLLRNIDLVRTGLNPDLDIGGVVLTMYDGRTRLTQDVSDQIRDHFKEIAFETVIPRSVRISEAPSFGEPIEVFDRASRGAEAYRNLTDEFRKRHGRKVKR